MIHWKDCDVEIKRTQQERWRKRVCRWEIEGESCNGVSRSCYDDEPHDICKVCDKLRGDA